LTTLLQTLIKAEYDNASQDFLTRTAMEIVYVFYQQAHTSSRVAPAGTRLMQSFACRVAGLGSLLL